MKPASAMRDRVIEWGGFTLAIAVGLLIASTGSGYLAQTVFMAALYILLATGWNVISGFTGYVSFGQVSFFGVGAYIAAIATLNGGLPWVAAVPVAVLGAVALALLLGMIMLRLNGIFFALGMFGLARILQIIASALRVTGGPMGTSVDTVDSPNTSAVVMVLVVAAVTIGVYAMLRTRLGLRLLAVRDDGLAAKAAGVNVAAIRVIGFCISAAIAATGGALYVWNIGYLDPSSAFAGTIELQTVLIVMSGGIATLWGPLVGGILISLLSTFLWAKFPMEQQIILGGLTILIAVAMPGGLMTALGRLGLLRRVPIWGPPPVRAGVVAIRTAPKATGAPILQCEGVGINYGGVIAVKGVDLVAYPGEMLAIIGPNGAGKSTLFNLISAFARPTAGRILFDGHVLPAGRPERLACRGIARTFQTSRLFASLTVWETVLLAAISLHGDKEAARAAAADILEQVGLAAHWAELPDTLSPGRQRLLEIARALALRPRVLLLDEAMAGMSSQEIARVHAALRGAMRAGCAVVAIEHVLPAIAPLAARVQVLDFGQTIAAGIPHDVLNDPRVIVAYLGADIEEMEDVG
jgi:branched-chain amino acid transport system permease protein